MNIIQALEQEQLRTDIPAFAPGDTVRVHVKVVEGTRERIQMFEGVVIARQGTGVRETFTVRRISYGVGVEAIVVGDLVRVDNPRERGIDRSDADRVSWREEFWECGLWYLGILIELCVTVGLS